MLRLCHCASVYVVIFLGYAYFSLHCVNFVHCWFLYWFSDNSLISVFLWSINMQSANMFWCWKSFGSFFVTIRAFSVLMYKRICWLQWPRGLRCRSTAACLLISWVWVPRGAWMSCLLCVVRSLCDELITCPEESYRLWCVVCDL